MRLVSHPNVVDLKAFFYSNGDKVSPLTALQEEQIDQNPIRSPIRSHKRGK